MDRRTAEMKYLNAQLGRLTNERDRLLRENNRKDAGRVEVRILKVNRELLRWKKAA